MTDCQDILSQLHHNLNILLEREASHAGNIPLDLPNQIRDHREAIELIEQATAGDISEADWRKGMKPLLVDIRNHNEEHPHWGVSSGDVDGGNIGAKIAAQKAGEAGQAARPIAEAIGLAGRKTGRGLVPGRPVVVGGVEGLEWPYHNFKIGLWIAGKGRISLK